jgi:4-hydroxybenzoate polyprenyltransferase
MRCHSLRGCSGSILRVVFLAYVLNDIADREADRLNPEKLDQLLACGDITITQAIWFAIVLGTIAILMSIALGTRYLYLTVPFVAFGIPRYPYLVDARNGGGDPARFLIRDVPLLLTVFLWIAADVILLYS